MGKTTPFGTRLATLGSPPRLGFVSAGGVPTSGSKPAGSVPPQGSFRAENKWLVARSWFNTWSVLFFCEWRVRISVFGFRNSRDATHRRAEPTLHYTNPQQDFINYFWPVTLQPGARRGGMSFTQWRGVRGSLPDLLVRGKLPRRLSGVAVVGYPAVTPFRSHCWPVAHVCR